MERLAPSPVARWPSADQVLDVLLHFFQVIVSRLQGLLKQGDLSFISDDTADQPENTANYGAEHAC